jgi:predicted DNA binding protein
VATKGSIADADADLPALSARQREVFELARARGYYEWPRAVSATDLAEEVGVAKATVLEHLRKAEAKLLGP